MMKILIYALLIYIVYKVFRSIMAPSGSSTTGSHGETSAVDDIMIKDPVCEIYFPKKDGICLDIDGNEVCFCSKECRDKYLKTRS